MSAYWTVVFYYSADVLNELDRATDTQLKVNVGFYVNKTKAFGIAY